MARVTCQKSFKKQTLTQRITLHALIVGGVQSTTPSCSFPHTFPVGVLAAKSLHWWLHRCLASCSNVSGFQGWNPGSWSTQIRRIRMDRLDFFKKEEPRLKRPKEPSRGVFHINVSKTLAVFDYKKTKKFAAQNCEGSHFSSTVDQSQSWYQSRRCSHSRSFHFLSTIGSLISQHTHNDRYRCNTTWRFKTADILENLLGPVRRKSKHQKKKTGWLIICIVNHVSPLSP